MIYVVILKSYIQAKHKISSGLWVVKIIKVALSCRFKNLSPRVSRGNIFSIKDIIHTHQHINFFQSQRRKRILRSQIRIGKGINGAFF